MLKKCRLCNEEKTLIRSHIVPEAFYKPLYDNKRRLFLSSQARNVFNMTQKGSREELLCEECDSKVIGNRYDRYGISVIRDSLHIEKFSDPQKEIWVGLDYNKFKVFLLSVLWRAHIASEFFRGITLEENIAKIIVESIRSGQAPKEDVIPIVGITLVDTSRGPSISNEIITHGNTYIREGQLNSKTYIIIFGGYAWTFIVPTAEEKDPQKELFLNESGFVILPKVNLFEFLPVTQIMESIQFTNDNFDRINRKKK